MDIYSGYVYSDNNPVSMSDYEGSVVLKSCRIIDKKLRLARDKAKDKIESCNYLERIEKMKIKNRTDTLFFGCAKCKDCAQTPYKNRVIICENNINIKERCGCLEAIIAHEAVHSEFGKNECIAYSIELNCFSCAASAPDCIKKECGLLK